MPNRFCRYALRTTDVEGARTFYGELFGASFWSAAIEAGPLPAGAAARGAPSHWLGSLGVDDVIGTGLRFLDLGAKALGGTPPGRSGRFGQTGPPQTASPYDPILADERGDVVLRDPFGALVGLTSMPSAPRDDRVAWHLLNVRDEERAFAVYAGMFGWTAIERIDFGAQRGRHVRFSCDGTSRCAGSVADLARLPHIHPQWLFFFRTENIDESLARVHDLGGLPLPIMTTPDGNRVAPCDDPQGAAFGLLQTSPSP